MRNTGFIEDAVRFPKNLMRVCVLSRCSCLALKLSRSICFSSSILRVWVFSFFFIFFFRIFQLVALVRCIIISIIFSEMLYSMLNFFLLFFHYSSGYFSFGLSNGFLYLFRMSDSRVVGVSIYISMVKMHLIYSCVGYSSFTGTNLFHIHIS